MLIKTLATVTAIAATALALLASAPGYAQSTTCQQFGMYVQCNTTPAYQPHFNQPIDFGAMQRNEAAAELQRQQAALIEAQRRELQRQCWAAGHGYCPL